MPTTLREYATQYDRNPENNFAVACYEGNTLRELEAALGSAADEGDCQTWQIDATEWHDAVQAALGQRVAEHNDANDA